MFLRYLDPPASSRQSLFMCLFPPHFRSDPTFYSTTDEDITYPELMTLRPNMDSLRAYLDVGRGASGVVVADDV